LLRDHGPAADEDWQPGRGLTGAEVCMHASFGPVRISQTTGSMVSHLTDFGDTHWLTGTAAACTSTFKPVWIDAGLPDLGPEPNETYDARTLWWRHENLHREILRDYAFRIKSLTPDRDMLEVDFIQSAADLINKSAEQRREYTEFSFSRAHQMETEKYEVLKAGSIRNQRPVLDKLAWNKFDRQAGRV